MSEEPVQGPPTEESVAKDPDGVVSADVSKETLPVAQFSAPLARLPSNRTRNSERPRSSPRTFVQNLASSFWARFIFILLTFLFLLRLLLPAQLGSSDWFSHFVLAESIVILSGIASFCIQLLADDYLRQVQAQSRKPRLKRSLLAGVLVFSTAQALLLTELAVRTPPETPGAGAPTAPATQVPRWPTEESPTLAPDTEPTEMPTEPATPEPPSSPALPLSPTPPVVPPPTEVAPGPTREPTELSPSLPTPTQKVETPTVQPPRIKFWVEPNPIYAGQCTLLIGQIENAREVYLNGKPVSTSFIQDECPPITWDYRLEVVGLDGVMITRIITVHVMSLPATTLQPSPTPRGTATSTPTNTPTPENTYTPTPTNVCIPSQRPVDVILVLDRSGSMAGQPLADAKQAAKSFIDAMHLSVDQVGLLTFAAQARLETRLTNQGDQVKQAIDALSAVDRDTNIGAGIIQAQDELVSSRHNSSALPVIILLSDGRPTTGDVSVAAQAAKQAGTRIITIGLGEDVDHELMRAIASTESGYYHAPTSEGLLEIYISIARTLYCDPATTTPLPTTDTPTPTLSPAPTSTVAPTFEPSETPTATITPTPIWTITPTFSPTPTPQPSPIACPVEPAPGRYLILFDGSMIRSDKTAAQAQVGPVLAAIPTGVYEVTLVSYDAHAQQPQQHQPAESWYLILKDDLGSVIATTNPIGDLPDAQDRLVEVVEQRLLVAQPATLAIAFHNAYPASNPNSVIPVCAAFDARETSTPTPTLSPTPTPRQHATLSPSPTVESSSTPTPASTANATLLPTPTPSASLTLPPLPTATPTPTTKSTDE